MHAINHLRRCRKAASAILAVGLFTAILYGLMAAPGLLTDTASTVPARHASHALGAPRQVAR